MLLGMPLGLEGTPLPLAGAVTAGHVTSMFSAVGGHGSIAIHGGAGGSPPPAGRVSRWVTHALDLREGFEAVWKGSFTAKNRNVCRKAERAGVTVSRVGAERAGDYYALYAAMTRTWGYATPPYPRELISALLDTDDAELWLAYLGDELAAGALLMGGSGDLLYWSGAMNREHAQVAPSNAVLRTVIESACTRGIEYLDFGASTGLPGVEAFKRSFGASAREYTEVSWSSWRHRALESSRRRLAGLRGRA
jgi:lipid II:glycine glycyltransferase (peptidoglycan interpeptide bridge formation enzyme)